jgi:ATP phosphoribosyltransferase
VSSITLALSKGRIFEETLPLLAAAGHHPHRQPRVLAQAHHRHQPADVRLVIVRATDTPTYVQYGAADLGIAGKDVLSSMAVRVSTSRSTSTSPSAGCAWRCSKDFDYAAASSPGARIRVATKYMNAAKAHFAGKGMHVDLIKLYGSMELAPLVGLADAIVDLVSTGGTLGQQPEEVEDIMPISSRLIVNQASLKLKRELMQPVLDAFAGAVKS